MEKTMKLIQDTSAAENHTTQIEREVKDLDRDISEIYNNLEYSAKVNKSLHSLDAALGTASQLLTVVGIIPSIRTQASNLKKSIDAYHAPVKKAVKMSDKVENVVKPVRENVRKVDEKVHKIDEVLLRTMNGENTFMDILCRAQNCINSQSPSDIKPVLEKHVEEASSTIDPAVLKFDGVQVTLLSKVEAANKKTDQFKAWVHQLCDLDAQINRATAILSPVIDALNAVAVAFKQTIRVPYGGYPIFRKKYGVPYPSGWQTVYYSFTIGDILNGAARVIKPILDLLNKAMEDVLRPLLKRLNLNIPLPEIPGLGILDDLAAQLDASFNGIDAIFEQFLIGQTSFDGYTLQMQQYLDNFRKIKVNCPLMGGKKCGPAGCWISAPQGA